MNKAFEKILERLEAESFERRIPVFTERAEMVIDFETAKQIVQEVAEKYNGGWIPCSERLPEIGQEVIVATKKGSVFSNIYYDYTESTAKEPCFHMWDDEMWNCFKPDVIAWQPLPEPFKECD